MRPPAGSWPRWTIRPTHAAVLAERAMLAALRGGCLAPVAALARVENGAAFAHRPGS